MINIIIDNDKGPKKRINLKFPAISGCLLFHPPNTGSSPAKSGLPDNRLTSGKIRSGSQNSIPVGSYSSPSVAKGGGGGGGMIHFVNSSVARDTVWELEGSM